MLKSLYDWVLHWAETPYGSPALFILAFTEASFFPIPPDPLLIALGLSIPTKSFYYAFLCSSGSVLGGMLGYYIGLKFMQFVGERIIEFYGFREKFDKVVKLLQEYDAWAVGIAGFTPIPYKVFTIAGGVSRISFPRFIIVSFISRSARFFLVSSLIYFFGSNVRLFIDKYFNLLTILFFILLILGFLVIRYAFKRGVKHK